MQRYFIVDQGEEIQLTARNMEGIEVEEESYTLKGYRGYIVRDWIYLNRAVMHVVVHTGDETDEIEGKIVRSREKQHWQWNVAQNDALYMETISDFHIMLCDLNKLTKHGTDVIAYPQGDLTDLSRVLLWVELGYLGIQVSHQKTCVLPPYLVEFFRLYRIYGTILDEKGECFQKSTCSYRYMIESKITLDDTERARAWMKQVILTVQQHLELFKYSKILLSFDDLYLYHNTGEKPFYLKNRVLEGHMQQALSIYMVENEIEQGETPLCPSLYHVLCAKIYRLALLLDALGYPMHYHPLHDYAKLCQAIQKYQRDHQQICSGRLDEKAWKSLQEEYEGLDKTVVEEVKEEVEVEESGDIEMELLHRLDQMKKAGMQKSIVQERTMLKQSKLAGEVPKRVSTGNHYLIPDRGMVEDSAFRDKYGLEIVDYHVEVKGCILFCVFEWVNDDAYASPYIVYETGNPQDVVEFVATKTILGVSNRQLKALEDEFARPLMPGKVKRRRPEGKVVFYDLPFLLDTSLHVIYIPRMPWKQVETYVQQMHAYYIFGVCAMPYHMYVDIKEVEKRFREMYGVYGEDGMEEMSIRMKHALLRLYYVTDLGGNDYTLNKVTQGVLLAYRREHGIEGGCGSVASPAVVNHLFQEVKNFAGRLTELGLEGVDDPVKNYTHFKTIVRTFMEKVGLNKDICDRRLLEVLLQSDMSSQSIIRVIQSEKAALQESALSLHDILQHQNDMYQVLVKEYEQASEQYTLVSKTVEEATRQLKEYKEALRTVALSFSLADKQLNHVYENVKEESYTLQGSQSKLTSLGQNVERMYGASKSYMPLVLSSLQVVVSTVAFLVYSVLQGLSIILKGLRKR